MYENRGGTEIYYSYDSYGAPTSIKYYEPDGTTYTFYLATNQQGDVIGIYNSSGNLAVKYEYDAWGNIISETNASGGTLSGTAAIWNEINPFRYRGYYYDAETGLYYLQSRYYDAETGRFINQDSYISTGTGLLGFNMFAYCDNNPVNGWDPTGEKTFECCPHGDCASCKAKKKGDTNEKEASVDFVSKTAVNKGTSINDYFSEVFELLSGFEYARSLIGLGIVSIIYSEKISGVVLIVEGIHEMNEFVNKFTAFRKRLKGDSINESNKNNPDIYLCNILWSFCS